MTPKMTAKEIHKRRLLEYLSDWNHSFPNRICMAEILGIKLVTLKFHFSGAELAEIENEGLELRKQRSGIPRSKIYDSMQKEAEGGNVSAQKEFLDRTEGKVMDRLQVGMDGNTLNMILSTLPPDQAEKTKKALLAISAKKTKR